MIVLDDSVYQAVADGSIAVFSEEDTVTFGDVTIFDVNKMLAVSGVADMAAINELVVNCFYIVKIKGISTNVSFPCSDMARSLQGSL